MMDAIFYIQRRGVGLYLNGDVLRAYPASHLDATLKTFIRDHREQLIEAIRGIRATPDLDFTIGNILALSPEDLVRYQREVEEAPDDRPHIEHDREASRRAQAVLQQRMKGAA